MTRKIKYILLILISFSLFTLNSFSVYAYGSGNVAPLTTPEAKKQTTASNTTTPAPSKSNSDVATKKENTTVSSPQPSTIEDAREPVKTFDELIDYYLSENDKYKNLSKKKKSKIRAYLSDEQYCSSAEQEYLLFEYQNARSGSQEIVFKINEAIDFFDKKGGQVINTSEINNINNSESMATGEMYAQDPQKAGGVKIAKSNGTAGDLEKALSGFVAGVADTINDLLIDCSASLDNLIYGRLIKYGTNYYCFELVKGNPYGIIASNVYIIFRNLAIPMVFLFLLYRFVKAAWNSGSSEKRRDLNDGITKSVLILLFLGLMPWLIDGLIAFKDIMLNYFYKNFNSNMSEMFGLSTSDTTTLVGYYKDVYLKGERFLDAALYLGVVCITLYYAVTYISTAVAEMINVIFFPFVTIFSFEDSKLINTWIKEMLGNIFNPVLDSVLLLIPLLMRQLCGGDLRGYIITLICAYAVIPSRSIIRRMIGVGGSMQSELLGFGALMAAGSMMRGISQRAKQGVGNAIGSIQSAKENHDLANMYADLARANGEGDQLTGRFAKLGKLSSVEDNEEMSLRNPGGINAEQNNEEFDNPQGNHETGLENPNGSELTELSSVKEDMETEEGIALKNGTSLNSVEAAQQNDGTEEQMLQTDNSANISGATLSNTQTGTNGLSNAGISPAEQEALTKNNILRNYANADNFTDKMFDNSFNFAERAKLHKQRANRIFQHGVARSVGGTIGGTIGGVALGAVTGSATMFAGGKVNAAATLAGVNYGSAIGSTVGAGIGYSNTFNYGVSDALMAIDSKTRGRKDGYYSRKVSAPNSNVVANPSTLSNYGNYDPRYEEQRVLREQQQMQRQREADIREQQIALQAERLAYNKEHDPIVDQLRQQELQYKNNELEYRKSLKNPAQSSKQANIPTTDSNIDFSIPVSQTVSEPTDTDITQLEKSLNLDSGFFRKIQDTYNSGNYAEVEYMQKAQNTAEKRALDALYREFGQENISTSGLTKEQLAYYEPKVRDFMANEISKSIMSTQKLSGDAVLDMPKKITDTLIHLFSQSKK